jgi:hypothetical protein
VGGEEFEGVLRGGDGLVGCCDGGGLGEGGFGEGEEAEGGDGFEEGAAVHMRLPF